MAENQMVEVAQPPRKFRSRAIRVDQWSPGIVQRWTPGKVKTVLFEHQEGDFSLSSQLVNAMLEDDELPSTVDTAINFITGAPVRFGVDDESSELTDELEEAWASCVPAAQMSKLLFWFEWLGVAVGTLDWHRAYGKWRCKLRALNPEFLWWDDGEINPQTGVHGVFRYGHRGNSDELVTPGDGRWVLLSDGRESWRHCSLRALAITWLIKQYTLRDLARYNERHGLPIVKAKIPAFADAADKQAFHDDVKSIGTDTTINLPSHMATESGHEVGYDLELLEAKDQSYETFFRTLDRCDRKFKMHFLGTNTFELEGTAGSRATQDSGRAIAMQKAQERVQRIVDDVREQIVRPIVEMSLGRSIASEEDLPTPRWLIEGDEDLEKRARTLDRFGAALIKFKTAGQLIANLEQEAAQYGLELEEAPEPEPMPTGPNGGPPNRRPNGPQEDDEQLDHGCDHERNTALLDLLESTGERDGFVAAQSYLDGLVDDSTARADAVERVDAERMATIINESDSPQALRDALEAEVEDAAPLELAYIFERAMILAQLSGRFAVEEDL